MTKGPKKSPQSCEAERFVPIREICERLSCTRQSIYERARLGTLGFELRKDGWRVGCLNSGFEAYLASLPKMEPGGVEQLDEGRQRAVARRREKAKSKREAVVTE